MKKLLWSAAVIAAVALVTGAQWFGARRSAPPITFAEVQSKYGAGARQIEVAGVTVNYRDEGSGPTLVLLHGSFGSLRMFDDMVAELEPSFRVIRYDQPPSGLSGPVPADFSLTSEAFLQEFLDGLGVGTVSVLGTSSGGIIGYRFAATYPERVNALILSNIPPSAPVDNAGARARLPAKLRWSMGTCIKYARPFSKTCWRDFLDSNFERRHRVTDALVTEYYDLNRRPGAVEFTSMTAIMREDAEVLRFLGGVKAPTQLIWGMRDPVLPPATAELLASRLTATTVRMDELDDVSHYPPLEAPQEVAELTADFLAGVFAQKDDTGETPTDAHSSGMVEVKTPEEQFEGYPTNVAKIPSDLLLTNPIVTRVCFNLKHPLNSPAANAFLTELQNTIRGLEYAPVVRIERRVYPIELPYCLSLVFRNWEHNRRYETDDAFLKFYYDRWKSVVTEMSEQLSVVDHAEN